MATEQASVRDCARRVIASIEASGSGRDAEKLGQGLLDATRDLLAREDLMSLGAKRPANHIDNSRYIYYDGALSITLDQIPKDKPIPPHDHGIWEALILVTGKLHHTVYERTDDGSVEGHADLKVIEDRDLTPGDLALVVPPSEIHSFTALEEETFILTIVGGNYKPTRHYYNVADKTVVVATPSALREAEAA